VTMQDKLGASPRIKHEVQVLAPNTPTCVMHNSESTIDYWISGGGASIGLYSLHRPIFRCPSKHTMR
jgi:hypothetical protein